MRVPAGAPTGSPPAGAGRERLGATEIRARETAFDVAAATNPASRLKPGALSPHGVAVAGADGYLFIGDGANRWEQQYAGRFALPEGWLEGWLGVLARRGEAARARGVALCNLVIPEKQVVYPEKRWPAGGPAADARPLMRLATSVPSAAGLYYASEELLACKALGPAHHRHDSHWTASGCLAVVDGLLRRLPVDVEAAEIAWTVDTFDRPLDLSTHFFEPAPAERHMIPQVAGEVVFDNQHHAKTDRYAGSVYRVRNPEAPVARKLMIFGDSYAFSLGLAGALTAVFADVTFVWSKSIVWDMVDEVGAEVIVWESAERFLATLPQA